MKHYLLSIYQPDGPPPPAPALATIMRNVHTVREEMQAAGAWVFSGGLCSPSTATVLRARPNDVLLTDGPFAEAKEHLGGFTIVTAPDLDAALAWGKKLARATTLPVEVRPFQDPTTHC
ncbi:MAG TPA: YciI family protein [Planctomycetota bacterium]|nr:YciI family protein [Planctomycetota bacterium]